MRNFLIASGSVHLWFYPLQETADPCLQNRYLALLSPAEITRMQRFRFDKHRWQFLLSHAFLRHVLSRYLGCPAESIAYGYNDYGKPFVDAAAGQPELCFSLSHANGLACCAVAKDGDVGVDVECTDRQVNGADISEQYFSIAEFADMMALADEQTRKERFFQLWVLKEAYIKAKGLGLSLPLDQFSFNFSERDRVGVKFSPKLDEFPESWNFSLLQPSERHQAAIAYKPADLSSTLALRTFQTCPLGVEEEIFVPLLATS